MADRAPGPIGRQSAATHSLLAQLAERRPVKAEGLGSNPRRGASPLLRRFSRYTGRMPYSDPEKQRTYQREWMARRRKEWLDANGPCIDCDSRENLEVDHVDAATKVSHRVWSWSQARRVAELAKCVVRCKPCHVAKTSANSEESYGEKNGQTRLTEDDVRAIRMSAEPERTLARRYGISNSSAHRIRSGETWRLHGLVGESVVPVTLSR